MLTKTVYFFLFCLLYSAIYAQTISIEGFVKEKGTNEAMPNTSLLLKGTTIGTTTDTSGYFKLKINKEQVKEDTVIVSSLGYYTAKISISTNLSKKMLIELTPQFFNLQELTVKPGENPAWRIMRNIIANK